ncbi:MAG: 30S ribosomal protein S21 [Candidatus Rokubacteria bacterium]|nr:30S ribosomal protein S21 [Candidatus Rokubacteria bacterium]
MTDVHRREASVIVVAPGRLGSALKRLKESYETAVVPSIRRHTFAESRGARRRSKHARAQKRAARAAARLLLVRPE